LSHHSCFWNLSIQLVDFQCCVGTNYGRQFNTMIPQEATRSLGFNHPPCCGSFTFLISPSARFCQGLYGSVSLEKTRFSCFVLELTTQRYDQAPSDTNASGNPYLDKNRESMSCMLDFSLGSCLTIQIL
jgi:hypothetical protein